MSDEASLSFSERTAIGLGRFINERPIPKRLQRQYLLAVTKTWVRPSIERRLYVEGMDWLLDAQPDRGIVVVANHRSFFDLYVLMLTLFHQGTYWIERMYFPVRSKFFYEKPTGVLINLLIGGGSMYPPLFHDREKAALNKDALGRLTSILQMPGNVVGLHPEGTRGKGPDPYKLLRAQPGVGQIVLQSKPIVVPVFINGLNNSIPKTIRDTHRKDAQRNQPVIAVFGEQPLDYSEFTTKKPRAALYKKCADKMLTAIASLGEREREIRAACARGDIADSDPNWLAARAARAQRRHSS